VERRFFNPSQPQTLQGAVFLLYANVVFGLLFRTGGEGVFAFAAVSLTRGNISAGLATLIGNLLAIFVVGGSFAAAYLIANEKKIGWRLGVVVAATPIVALAILIVFGDISLINALDIKLLFDVALLVLLLHDQTRSYERTWFK